MPRWSTHIDVGERRRTLARVAIIRQITDLTTKTVYLYKASVTPGSHNPRRLGTYGGDSEPMLIAVYSLELVGEVKSR